MASDAKTSQLPAAPSFENSDILPIVQNGANYKLTKTVLVSSITNLPTSDQKDALAGNNPSASNKYATMSDIPALDGVGSQAKIQVAVATTADITLYGEQTIDGVTTSASRVLVKNQTDQKTNGIYVSSAGDWSRASDCDTAEKLLKALVSVSGGQSQTGYVYFNSNDSIVFGTTNITFSLFSTPTADATRLEWHATPSNKLFSTFYSAQSVSSMDSPYEVWITGSGHEIDNKGSAYTNLSKLTFRSDSASKTITVKAGATGDSFPHLKGRISVDFQTTSYFCTNLAQDNNEWKIEDGAVVQGAVSGAKIFAERRTYNNVAPFLNGGALGNSYPNGESVFEFTASGANINVVINDQNPIKLPSRLSNAFAKDVTTEHDASLTIKACGNYIAPADNYFDGYMYHYFKTYYTNTAIVPSSTDARYVTDNVRDALNGAANALSAENPAVDTTTLNSQILQSKNIASLYNDTSLDNFTAVNDTGLVVNNGASAYYPSLLHDANAFGANDGYNFKIIYSVGSSLRVIKSKDCSNGSWTTPVSVTGLAATAHHPTWIYSADGFGTQGTIKYKVIYWNSSVSNLLISTLRYAESADGVTYINDQPLTQDATYPLISGHSGDWNAGTWGFLKIFENRNATNTGSNPFDYTYTAYYDANTGSTYETIGLAYSTDMKHWVRYEPNAPVLDRTSGDSGAWDYYTTSFCGIYRDVHGYHMWYTGGKATGNTDNYGWGYASSPDGLATWTKSASNPIMTVNDGITYRDQRCYTPSVADDGCGTVYIVYTAQGSAQSGAKCLALATLKYKAAQGVISASSVGLGNVTNDAQTKASIVPNTAPSAGQMLVGNEGGTAYAPTTMEKLIAIQNLANAAGVLKNDGSGGFTYETPTGGGDITWNGTTAFDTAVYAANNMSTGCHRVKLTGINHTINNKGSVYTNFKNISFDGGADIVRHLHVADLATLDGLPQLIQNVNLNTKSTQPIVENPNNSQFFIGEKCSFTPDTASCCGIQWSSINQVLTVIQKSNSSVGSISVGGAKLFDMQDYNVGLTFQVEDNTCYLEPTCIYNTVGSILPSLQINSVAGFYLYGSSAYTHFNGTFGVGVLAIGVISGLTAKKIPYAISSTAIQDSGFCFDSNIMYTANGLTTYVSGQSQCYSFGSTNFVGAPFSVVGKNFDNDNMSSSYAAISQYGDKQIYYGDVHDVDGTPTARDIYNFDPINDIWQLYDEAGNVAFDFNRSNGNLTISGAITATNVGSNRPDVEIVTTSNVVLTAASAKTIIVQLETPTTISVTLPDATVAGQGWDVTIIGNTDNAAINIYKNDGTTGVGSQMVQHTGRYLRCAGAASANGTWNVNNGSSYNDWNASGS